MAEVKYWLWLTTRRGVGLTDASRLLAHFGGAEEIWQAKREELGQVKGLRADVLNSLCDKGMEPVDKILADCQRVGARVLTFDDPRYPSRLRQLPDPPLVLYYRGVLPDFEEELTIGVVGMREPTEYGRQMARKLGTELTEGGATVVSGIAKGLDSEALHGAMEVGGHPISVLAGGVDVYYPAENRDLYEEVARQGTLLTEYPPGTRNFRGNFPVRNRIISGLSYGTVAVECREKSGTMSTMNRALEQDRDIFAVPGLADSPQCRGSNLLIQQGAKLVTCGADILEEYSHLFPAKLDGDGPKRPDWSRMDGLPVHWESPLRHKRSPEPIVERPEPTAAPAQVPVRPKEEFPGDQLTVLQALEQGPRYADELVELTGLPARGVSGALTMLQLAGAVREEQGRRFRALVSVER